MASLVSERLVLVQYWPCGHEGHRARVECADQVGGTKTIDKPTFNSKECPRCIYERAQEETE